MNKLLFGIAALAFNFAYAGDWADFTFVNNSDHPVQVFLRNGYGTLNWTDKTKRNPFDLSSVTNPYKSKYKDAFTTLEPGQMIDIGRLMTTHNCNYTDRKQDELLVTVYDPALAIKLPYVASEHPNNDARYWGSSTLHVNLATPYIGVVGCENNDDYVQFHTSNEPFGGRFRVISNITGSHWGAGLNFEEQPGGTQLYEINYMGCSGAFVENVASGSCKE